MFSDISRVPQLLSVESRIETQVCLNPEPMFFPTKFSVSLINTENQCFMQVYCVCI